MVCAVGGLQQGALEENIDVEHFATMPLVSDFLEVLQQTWGSWSLSTKFAFKKLTSKKHLPENNSVQNKTAEVSRAGDSTEATEALTQSLVNTTLQTSLQERKSRSYYLEEVALHNKRNDCWIAIKDKVYDVSKFAEQHPGGEVIYTHAGRDGTDIFTTFHASTTWKTLQDFYIGDLKSVEPTPELLTDYRELRAAFLRARLFRSSKVYYTLKTLTNLALLAGSIAVISVNQSMLGIMLSAILMATCFQQCGWLSHDFLHHQVFETRWLNNVVGYAVGNVLLGFSTSWWKNKHNLHHAAPNECDHMYKPIDEDIDTLPLLAWSKDILATVDNKVIRKFLEWQHVFFLPVLMFARFSWLLYSWLYTNRLDMPLKTKVLEKGTILAHYAWFVGAAFWFLPPSRAIVWMLATEFLTGAFLGGVFVLSHNGMEVYNTCKDFVNAQVVSTRDIKANMFNDWFTGGLNRQIEHHLFPSMPRHNLNKISAHVESLCKKHNLVYEDLSMGAGTIRVLETLAEVAAAAAVTS